MPTKHYLHQAMLTLIDLTAQFERYCSWQEEKGNDINLESFTHWLETEFHAQAIEKEAQDKGLEAMGFNPPNL